MNKELEALKIGIPKLKKLYENSAKKMSQNDILGFDLTFVYLDKALQRLESIDNSNPSEALECLEWVIKNYIGNDYYVYEEELITIKQALLKAQEQEKVLEIIKEKEVSIFWLKGSKTVKAYNYAMDLGYNEYRKLTEEEFELLKKWLG